MRRRRLLAAGGAAALVLGGGFILTRRGTDGQDAALPGIRIAVSRTPLSTPLLVAEDLGYYTEAGLGVTLVEVIGGHRSFASMANGETDLGTCSDSVLMFNAFKRKDFVTLGSFVRSANDIKLMTHAQSGISGVEDLPGRRVAAVRGSASEYFLHTCMLFWGLDPRDTQIVYMDPEGMPDALRDREVDAISVWEPYGFQAFQALRGQARVFDTKGLYTLNFNLVGLRDYVEVRRMHLEKLLHALCRAVRFINADADGAKRIVRRRLNLGAEFIDWIWSDYIFRLGLRASLVSSLENEARWAIDQGLVGNQALPNFRSLLDKRYLSGLSGRDCGA